MLVKFKRSSESGKVPLTTDLEFGEIAINYEDGLIYYKKPDGTIASIGGAGGGGGGGIDEETAIVLAIALG
jgi:hypothetical protein